MKVDIDGLRRLLANPCCGACVIKATEGALPALLAEAEAGRQLEAEVAEFLRAEVAPVPIGDGKHMVFRSPSLKMAMQMLKSERDIAIDAMRRSRDEYAERAHCFERAAYAGRKLRDDVLRACGDDERISEALADYDAAVAKGGAE